MVKAATSRGYIKTAMRLVDDQAKSRADLAASAPGRGRTMGRLEGAAANVEARRTRVTAEAGPALYLAKLFGSVDTETIVRLITALLALRSIRSPSC
ncbi:MAG TPA: hypothetical protein VGJ20_09905 [Xanthobacteraceae bacterium]|jgi:hypothetical protein